MIQKYDSDNDINKRFTKLKETCQNKESLITKLDNESQSASSIYLIKTEWDKELLKKFSEFPFKTLLKNNEYDFEKTYNEVDKVYRKIFTLSK